MDDGDDIDKEAVVDTVVDDEVGYGSLSQYMAEPAVSLHQYPDKVLFKLNLMTRTEYGEFSKTLEIPSVFKGSLFCQAIIACCYTDDFRARTDVTINNYILLFFRFFLFLTKHDENCRHDAMWSALVSSGYDLPHTVMQEFCLSLSEGGTGATAVSEYKSKLKKPIAWAAGLNNTTGDYNFTGGDRLLPYLQKKVNPEIKKDDTKPKIALSQLFSIDYETGKKIECPYSDSQLITNLRWFAHWYLGVMRKRRLFLRTIKWDEKSTIYEVLTERIKNGTWSLDSNPVKSMFGKDSKEDLAIPRLAYLEASSMYAKIYEALLPSKGDVEQIERGHFSVEVENRLLWLEPLGFKQVGRKAIFKTITNYQSNIGELITRIKSCISYNTHYSMTSGRGGEKIFIPISLRIPGSEARAALIPNFSLTDMILPTESELLVMSWLLASDCIQMSNQYRLNLTDFIQSDRGKTLTILTTDTVNDVDVNQAKIRHHKERGKGGDVNKKGKRHETITYERGDPLLATYTNWLDDMTEAQVHLKKGQGKWFYCFPPRNNKATAYFPLSFQCAKTSQFRTAYEKHEQGLKYHSELNGQGAFRWLLSAHVNHMAYVKNNIDKVSEIFLNLDAVRQSRIIFNEGQGMTDAENAKETAHGEDQVASYREAGVAKERILNGIKGNVQVANKMIEEAMSILESCHMMSVDEVQKSLHDPSGFTANDVIKFINEIAVNSEKYDMTIFGGIIDKADPHSGNKIINDKNSAMMMWSYIKHMESELQSIEENHDEEQIVKHLVEHAQWSILFDRFPHGTQRQGKALAEQYTIPYPPLF
ncbi:hypothetical protein [Colwellia sp. Bg11-28]|uniref:hypothetical protein n=1 Tax=Colwellia sp. Bg11-28 TaxID=2058305 RepID=UPI000C31DB13|nr:hypothetical protein [Colwellia sp. Bg11-28]PKH85445.1 hypothetical protein CXF79_19475 [Colwellia sp. Bg11-28]